MNLCWDNVFFIQIIKSLPRPISDDAKKLIKSLFLPHVREKMDLHLWGQKVTSCQKITSCFFS